MKELYIVRGLPGSGKSTLARSIADEVCEADSYFYVYEDPETKVVHRHFYGGEYRFDANLLPIAHEDCKIFCEGFMFSEVERIAVSNTFTQEWEMKPYFDLAKQYGYRVHTIIVESRHGSKNIHDVPDTAIDKMKNRFEIKL
jgi:KaiC/GvpD/RAD55 family RecA-like ATPase